MKNEEENCRMEAGSQAQNQMTSMNKAKSEGRYFSRPDIQTSAGLHLFLGPKVDSSLWLHSPLSSSGPCQCLQPHPGSWPFAHGSACCALFSLFPNTKTISVWHRSFSPSSHPGSGPLSSFKSRLREVPRPFLTVSLMVPRFIASVSVAISRDSCPSSWVILSPSWFPSF